MNDKVFLDSNILIYSYSFTESDKQQTARKLIIENNSFISTQVLQELVNTLTRKFKFNYDDALRALEESCINNYVLTNSEKTITSACKIADRYGFSFYDSLIISSALESDCSILYSEDLNNGQVIERKLKIVNPFI